MNSNASAIMNNSKMHTIEQKIDSFPPLPATVARVIDVTNDPDSSANDLVRTIVSDQSMCAAILKIANSSLFGTPKKVRSLERAIMVLGFNEVQSIVLGKAVMNSFDDLVKQHKNEITSFWDHSFTSGLAAKIIGEHLNQSAGQFFICGLLHDIGKLAMLLTFPGDYSPGHWMIGFSNREQLKDEKERFSLNHDLVGSHLLKKWSFPEDILIALEYHHSPNMAPKFAAYALVIQLADLLAFFCCNPAILEEQDFVSAINHYLPELETQWRELGLPWEEVAIETWFAWLKIEHENGSSIITILSS